ncbi:regulatory protein RecX [Aliagarivorans marinus]|uniref:regulatory protein RecX n=1 Tax=Aliagarivorans marinus TaxID=561965 RepID=UPI00041EF479|nr:regulatory protein RecX [Aliagarivorans marinus]
MTTPKAAVSAAMQLLSRRNYSEQQLFQKLLTKDFSDEQAQLACDYAIENGWLNDRIYAEQLVRSQFSKAYGPKRASMYLQSKGIAANLASEIVAEPDWDWYAALEKAFHRKYTASDLKNWQQRSKVSAYLYRRGFASDLINILYQEVTSEDGE